MAALCRPARAEEEVGGDFYDLFPLGGDRYGLLLGDVQGKGKEAAASTALLRYAARALAGAGSGPAAVLDQLNRLLDAQEREFGTASLFLGLLDAPSGRLALRQRRPGAAAAAARGRRGGGPAARPAPSWAPAPGLPMGRTPWCSGPATRSCC